MITPDTVVIGVDPFDLSYQQFRAILRSWVTLPTARARLSGAMYCGVVALGQHLQIRQRVVRLVAVDVVNLKAVGYGPMSGFPDYAMHVSASLTGHGHSHIPIDSQGSAGISRACGLTAHGLPLARWGAVTPLRIPSVGGFALKRRAAGSASERDTLSGHGSPNLSCRAGAAPTAPGAFILGGVGAESNRRSTSAICTLDSIHPLSAVGHVESRIPASVPRRCVAFPRPQANFTIWRAL